MSRSLGVGATGGDGGPIWDFINVWLPDVGHVLLGMAVAAVVNWAKGHVRPMRHVEVRLFGPDGRVARIVRVTHRTGEPAVLSSDPDQPDLVVPPPRQRPTA